MKNVFKTHGQVGDAECYYRLFPSMHLSHSNFATKFFHSGFRHEDAEKCNSNDKRTFHDKPEKVFKERICMEDRYDFRCEFEKQLKNISLAQFVKVFRTMLKFSSNIPQICTKCCSSTLHQIILESAAKLYHNHNHIDG